MNWNEATLEGCRDGLAEFKGWELTYSDDETQEPFWYNENGRPGHIPCQTALLDHPIPDTIDAIVASLPEGWYWRCIDQYSDGWYIQAREINTHREVRHDQCKDELLARARCACLAWEASRK